MLQPYHSVTVSTPEGLPMGGRFEATGIMIYWQNGPPGRGEERIEPNGAFVETVICAAIERLQAYQATKFSCAENETALNHLEKALKALEDRTANREKRNVEGTYEV